MIVIYDLEGFQVAENKSSLSCVVSTGFEDRFGDLLCLSDLEPPMFLKTLLAENSMVESAIELFEDSYREFVLENAAAIFPILQEFVRQLGTIDLVCVNKCASFDYCNFLLGILKAHFEVRIGG